MGVKCATVNFAACAWLSRSQENLSPSDKSRAFGYNNRFQSTAQGVAGAER
jgi:hypothetical protein